MRMLTAQTFEIDDIEAAVSDILEQLDPEHKLQSNSLGFLSCYSEFIDTGVVKALCERLPFDVIGTTTLGSAVTGGSGMMMLCLSVLTAEDVFFSSALSDPLSEGTASVSAAYCSARSALSGDPSLMVAFLPMMPAIGGEFMLNELDRASAGVPVFGTVACDHLPGNAGAAVIYNGQIAHSRLAIALLSGNIHPRFFASSISERKLQRQRGIISSSEGTLLKEVNGMPMLSYLETLGLSRGNGIEGLNAIPFLVDFNDGTAPAVRAVYSITPEGYAVCGGSVPQGCVLAVGSLDYNEVLETSRQIISGTDKLQDKNGFLMFPCMSRNMALGADVLAELDAIRNKIAGSVPCHIAYSGGELCPVYTREGKPVNRFHNYSINICVL